MQKRAPVVAVMGHVDHGKTTLLDSIRKTDIAGKEAGGITQSIGVCEVLWNSQKITFIDTPGHEAFRAMRTYGAKVADLAVLVVAGDDGVRPQTKDALEIIRESKTPFIVAVTKTDKPESNTAKVQNDLAQLGVFLEGKGGDVPWQAVSGKTGNGVKELLDLVLLASEMENLSSDPEKPVSGIVLTSARNSREGILASAVVKNGTLRRGDFIKTSGAAGKVKSLISFVGALLQKAEPGTPVTIIGFENLPKIGEEFIASEKPFEAKMAASEKTGHAHQAQKEAENKNRLAIVLRSAETGSLEALRNVIAKIISSAPESASVIESGVGDITETVVKTALAENAAVIGFKTKPDAVAKSFMKNHSITLIVSDIIYDIEEKVRALVEKQNKKEAAYVEIKALFGPRRGKEQVVGGIVGNGAVINASVFEIWSGNAEIGKGKIVNLQSQKKNVLQANAGSEVGLLIESAVPVAVGNRLVFQEK